MLPPLLLLLPRSSSDSPAPNNFFFHTFNGKLCFSFSILMMQYNPFSFFFIISSAWLIPFVIASSYHIFCSQYHKMVQCAWFCPCCFFHVSCRLQRRLRHRVNSIIVRTSCVSHLPHSCLLLDVAHLTLYFGWMKTCFCATHLRHFICNF